MRLLLKFVGLVAVIATTLTIGVFFLLSDANRLKPEVEALLARQAQAEVRILGELNWSLWPPVSLTAEQLVVHREDLNLNLATIALELDLKAIWQDTNKWQLKALRVTDLGINQAGAKTHIDVLTLHDFQPGQPAKLALNGTYASPNETPIAGSLQAQVLYTPDPKEQLLLRNAQFNTEQATGICVVDVTRRNGEPESSPDPTPDDILPLDALRSFNIVADCQLSQLIVDEHEFNDGVLQLANMEGQLNVYLEIRDFLDGVFAVDTDVDVTQSPPVWVVTPNLDNVAAADLMAWSSQRARWVAPLAANGVLHMRGNTSTALLQSLKGKSQFDGGQGQLDISLIKQQILQVAALAQRTDKVAAWPDTLNYETLTGEWQVDGLAQSLNVALDNVRIEANGDYDYLADAVNMLAHVTVGEAPEGSPITINPMLQDTPIPLRCKGSTAQLKCRLDKDAAQNIVAAALTGDSDTGLRRKLEDKIQEDVPEEYQEAARDLLDLLGRALEDN